MNLFEFECHVKPISSNNNVRHGRRGSYKTTEYIKFQRQMLIQLVQIGKKDIPKKPLEASYRFHIPRDIFYTKKGEIKLKGDTDNLIKTTQDMIAKFLGFNDALIVKITAERVPCDNWKVSGYLNIYEGNNTI